MKLGKYLFITMLFVIASCGLNHDGFVAVSSTMEEAKEREVFLSEYKISDYGNSKQFGFDGNEIIWLEQLWRKDSKNPKGVSLKNTGTHKHLKINLKTDESILKYREEWFLGDSYEFNFRTAGKKSLLCDFKDVVPDKIIIPIMSKEVLDGSNKFKIGEIILEKVK